jgi:hypothetical protein
VKWIVKKKEKATLLDARTVTPAQVVALQREQW